MSGNVKIRKNANRICTTVPKSPLEIGDFYSYLYDATINALIITKSETGNKVSRKKSGSTFKPLIDIRDKETLSKFKDFEQLKIEVLETEIRVTGYKRKQKACILDKVISFAQAKRQKESAMQKTFQLSLDLNFVAKAVGESVSTTIDKHFGANTEISKVLKVVSLFVGAGFSDYGLLQAKYENLSFEMVRAYEVEEDMCATYAHNLGSHVLQKDITELDPMSIPNADIMVASPPCQGFSSSNRNMSQEKRDKLNRLTLLTADLIRANKTCKMFVIENVPEMLTYKKGKYLNYFLTLLSDFNITYGVLNAADFGAPQRRRRAFIIGSKIGRIELPKPTHTPEMYATVREALRDCHDGLPNMTGTDDFVDSGKKTLAKIKEVPWGGNWRDLLPKYEKDFLFRKDGTPRKEPHTDVYRKLHPDYPCQALANFRKSCISNPFTNRILTVREGCRLLGVPDHYVILGNKTNRIQQIANGVVPAVMTAIGTEILKVFHKFFNGGCLQLLSN